MGKGVAVFHGSLLFLCASKQLNPSSPTRYGFPSWTAWNADPSPVPKTPGWKLERTRGPTFRIL